MIFNRRKKIKVAPDLMVFEDQYWSVNQRLDTNYPGYLIVSAKERSEHISDLSREALMLLGPKLAELEKLLFEKLKPKKVIVTKLGFTAGIDCHFHVIPVYKWVWSEIRKHPKYLNKQPDGADFVQFITREYCQFDQSLPIEAESKKLALFKLKFKRDA